MSPVEGIQFLSPAPWELFTAFHSRASTATYSRVSLRFLSRGGDRREHALFLLASCFTCLLFRKRKLEIAESLALRLEFRVRVGGESGDAREQERYKNVRKSSQEDLPGQEPRTERETEIGGMQ